MEQRISLVTLGVSDVGRAKEFYDRLGWTGQEVEQTVFFQAGGMAVVLWGRDELAADGNLDDRGGSGGVAIAQNVRTSGQVDDVLAAVTTAGGTVTQPARETFYGGYAGYFTDPDGHAWEVAYNPGFTIADDGSLTLPDFGASQPPD